MSEGGPPAGSSAQVGPDEALDVIEKSVEVLSAAPVMVTALIASLRTARREISAMRDLRDAASRGRHAAEGRYEQLVDALGLVEVVDGVRSMPSVEAAMLRAVELRTAYDELQGVLERVERMIDQTPIGTPP